MKRILLSVIVILFSFCANAAEPLSKAVILDGSGFNMGLLYESDNNLNFDVLFSDTDDRRKISLFPGKRTKVMSKRMDDDFSLNIYATSSANNIKVEVFMSCIINGKSGNNNLIINTKDHPNIANKAYENVGFCADATNDIAYSTVIKLKTGSGKPLADFCPTSLKTIADTVQYGMTIKKYFEPAGTLVEKSSTNCTYQGTVITKVSGQPTTTEKNKKISVALDTLVK